jgi:hypothetical protein
MVPSDMSVTQCRDRCEPGFRRLNNVVLQKFHRANVKEGEG